MDPDQKSLETVFSIAICRQMTMAIENSVSNDFLSIFVASIKVFDCRLPGVRNQTIIIFEKKVDFERNQQTTKKYAKLPTMQKIRYLETY